MLASRSSAFAALLGGALATTPPGPPYLHTGPLTCQANDKFPMLPTFHIIGNVTQATDGAIKLEPINDCSGVTFYKGIYHVWHQCCQSHWDHVGDSAPLSFPLSVFCSLFTDEAVPATRR